MLVDVCEDHDNMMSCQLLLFQMQENDENHFRGTLHTESQINNYTLGMLNLIQICSVLLVCILCFMFTKYEKCKYCNL